MAIGVYRPDIGHKIHNWDSHNARGFPVHGKTDYSGQTNKADQHKRDLRSADISSVPFCNRPSRIYSRQLVGDTPIESLPTLLGNTPWETDFYNELCLRIRPTN